MVGTRYKYASAVCNNDMQCNISINRNTRSVQLGAWAKNIATSHTHGSAGRAYKLCFIN